LISKKKKNKTPVAIKTCVPITNDLSVNLARPTGVLRFTCAYVTRSTRNIVTRSNRARLVITQRSIPSFRDNFKIQFFDEKYLTPHFKY